MKIALLVVVDVPEEMEPDTSEAAQLRLAAELQERCQRGSKGEWRVTPQKLTPAEIAALP